MKRTADDVNQPPVQDGSEFAAPPVCEQFPHTDRTPSEGGRPNIVVFLTDDHAQWASGPYGDEVVSTPSLDHLAATGVTFENAFTITPVCSPARATFWTGKIPSQHGVHDYIADSDPEVARTPWLRGQRTLAADLKEIGYVTAMVGKWHLGQHDEQFAPFDYWFQQSGGPPAPTEHYGTGPELPPLQEGFDRHAITDHAIAFLRNREQERPFFLVIGHFATHSPWTANPERLVARNRRRLRDGVPVGSSHPQGRMTSEATAISRRDPVEARAQYYAATELIDEQVGRVLDELEAQGLREKTVIAYTSDHGLNAGQHGLWGKGNATYPYNFLEESIRVPLIITGPGRTIWPQRRSEPATTCDLHATVLDWAGSQATAGPGRSLVPLCEGRRSAPDWSNVVFGEYGDSRMIRTDRYKLIRRHGYDPDECYDLQTDPTERHNRINDPEISQLIVELDTQLEEFFSTWADPEQSGTRVRSLPRHNNDESWRRDGSHRLTLSSAWTQRYSTGGFDR